MNTEDMVRRLVFIVLLIFFSFCNNNLCGSDTNPDDHDKGGWKLLKRSIGISAMHIALLPNDRFIVFDRSIAGSSNISLPGANDHGCNINGDCYAHSIEFSPSTRSVRALKVKTDTFCSSGAISSDGVLVQTGGFNNGDHAVRYFKPCNDSNCDWEEHVNDLSTRRWYASNHILPNGKIIVVGGRREFTYEFIPKTSPSDAALHYLPFLEKTRDSLQLENNLYPFLHLAPDGNLFVFANNRSILLDYKANRVVRDYPVMPGGVSRNYPSSGSSVLLPLKLSTSSSRSSITTTSSPTTMIEAEVLICGGTPSDSNTKANNGMFVLASNTCGRLVITEENPKWEMEEMPFNRTMGDMVLLPNGDVMIINGASRGTAGWNVARDPVLQPVLYQPCVSNNSSIPRFKVLKPSTIPRLYHSVAYLLSDARILVGGSNPYIHYTFDGLYPTELSLEAFSPPYLSRKSMRPQISFVTPGTRISYKQRFSVGFQCKVEVEDVKVTLVAPPFTTHSVSMSQRLLVLDMGEVRRLASGSDYAAEVYAPATEFLAPQGYYRLFVVNGGVPSRAVWVHIS
ncbi:hypothetical protein Syun_019880 [Stephania yunnanensis]|uniref:Galactose oxidase n=1 Tax=Stephania yunnanensis TaxID=152371 RepID=A0AAP0IUZ9_9MAGN